MIIISNLGVMGWAFIRLDHRAPVIQSNISFFTISRNTNVEGLVLFLTNNGTLRLVKKLLLLMGCVLGNDSVSICTKVLSSWFIYKAIYRT